MLRPTQTECEKQAFFYKISSITIGKMKMLQLEKDL